MKRTLFVLGFLLIASMLLTACGGGAEFVCEDEIGCVSYGPDEPVHIASMLTISGATAFLGEDSVGAIEIAIADRGGEILGHEILYTSEDSGCSPEGGQTAATKVTADPTIVGVVGTNCSSAMTAAMDTISAAGLSILSPSNTAPALTLEGQTWKPGYYRVCHTDLFQGSVAAEFAYNELGARSLATIHDGITELIATHAPAVLAVESVYYGKNVRSTVALAHARGVILARSLIVVGLNRRGHEDALQVKRDLELEFRLSVLVKAHLPA